MDHSLVEKRFLKARHTYEDHAQVQRHMAEDLIFKLKNPIYLHNKKRTEN